jgi:hypothetical protein
MAFHALTKNLRSNGTPVTPGTVEPGLLRESSSLGASRQDLEFPRIQEPSSTA